MNFFNKYIMKEEKEIVKKFSMYLRAGLIEAGPPLSTILGNYGLNTVKFCEDINNFTKDLPDYFLLKIVIIVYDDRTYEYNVIEPSTSFYLRLVSYDKAIFVNSMGGLKKRLIKVISVEDFFQTTHTIYKNSFIIRD